MYGLACSAELKHTWLGVWDTMLDPVTVHFLELSGNTWMYSSWCFHHSFHFGNLLNAIAQLDHMGIGKHLRQWKAGHLKIYSLRSEAWIYELAHKIIKMQSVFFFYFSVHWLYLHNIGYRRLFMWWLFCSCNRVNVKLCNLAICI